MVYLRDIFYNVAISAVFIGCSVAPRSETKGEFTLARLTGRWEYTDNKTHQIEEWRQSGDKELTGRGFVLEGKDTTFIEFLSIKENGDVLTYYVKASDINSEEVIPFTLISQSADKLEFANMQNDFPKKIVYELKSDSIMQAYIEGPRDGKTARIVFDFVKRKNTPLQ